MTMTEPARPAAPSRGAADEMAALVTPLCGGALPVRLRAWDGSVAGPGPLDGPRRPADRPQPGRPGQAARATGIAGAAPRPAAHVDA